MQDHEQLRQEFVAGLARLADEGDGNAVEGDARIDAMIRGNVLDILRKMYCIHHDAVWLGKGPVERLELDRDRPKPEQVRAVFEGFTTMLREEWQGKLEKDQLYGRDDDARKGRVMLAALEDALGLLASLRAAGGAA